MAMLDDWQIDAFKRIVAKFDSLFDTPSAMSVDDFFTAIQQDVYGAGEKSHAIYFKNPETVETRGARPQRTAMDYYKSIKLNDMFLDELGKLDKFIPVNITKVEDGALLDSKRVVNAFYKFVVYDAKGDWKFFKGLLPGHMDNFPSLLLWPCMQKFKFGKP